MRAQQILSAAAITVTLLCGTLSKALADAPSGIADLESQSEATTISRTAQSEATDQTRAALKAAPAAAQAEPTVLIERASGERLAAAIGHYARARSLLIAAIREFDTGAQLANPQSLLDIRTFRHTLLDRAEDLEHLLDPQPRVSRGGVRFEADSRLLGEARK